MNFKFVNNAAIFLFGFLWLVNVFGCESSSPDSECDTNADCPPSTVCDRDDNTCVECSDDFDCGDGLECRQNRCVLKRCTSTFECGDFDCIDGTCAIGVCSSDTACAPGDFCNSDGTCQTGSCSASSECRSGCCKLGRCYYLSVCNCMTYGCERRESDFINGCANGLDDNGNGQVDCADPACACSGGML